MVRRKGMAARGLANQLRMQLTSSPTSSAAAAKYGGWQPATVPLSLPQWQWHQQSQPILRTLCNKMTGCMPRQPILPQPEPSSRKLSRLRRNLMSSHPQRYGAVPQQMAMPQCPWSVVAEPPTMPRNVAETRQLADDNLQQAKLVKRQQERQARQLWQRLQLQQREHQQQRQRQQQIYQRQQQQQRWQVSASVATPTVPPKIHFKPFNFGKCAENYLNSEQCKTEFTLYAASNGSATQVGPGGKPVSILKTTQQAPLKQCEDFGYVKAAKQMVDSATDCGKPAQFSASGNASSITTLSSKCDCSTQGCQSVENSYQKLMSSSQITLRPSNESLHQIAAGIDSNLSALRQLLEQQPQAPQIDTKELEGVATLLHERIGVDTKPGVHLKGGESQQTSHFHSETVSEQELEPEPETVSKCSYDRLAESMSLTSSFKSLNELPAGTVRSSHERLASMGTTKLRGSHERQLNLNKLFQQQHIQSGESCTNANPMWETLMQLANQMCENRDESTEKPPKQYSIYLMVSSDEENEETEAQQPQMENSSAIYPACIPDRMSYKHPEHFGEPAVNYYPWHSGARRKKKRKLWSKKWEKSNLLLNPRRPLHWPKPDYSCLAAPKKPKKPKINWLQFSQPSRRCHYRWVQ